MEIAQRALLELVGDFYSAASDEAGWEGVATKVAAAFDSPSCALHLRPLSGPVKALDATPNLVVDSDPDKRAQQYWRRIDLWVARAKLPIGTPVLAKDIVAARGLERSEFDCKWGKRQRIFHVVCAVAALPDGAKCSLGIHRPRDGEPFGEEHRELARCIFPHYVRALHIRQHLRQQTASTRETANRGVERSAMRVGAESLRTMWELTPAESIVAEQVINGCSGKEIARRNRVSLATVRTQIGAILSKSRTRRASEFVSVTLRNSARLSSGSDTPPHRAHAVLAPPKRNVDCRQHS